MLGSKVLSVRKTIAKNVDCTGALLGYGYFGAPFNFSDENRGIDIGTFGRISFVNNLILHTYFRQIHRNNLVWPLDQIFNLQ